VRCHRAVNSNGIITAHSGHEVMKSEIDDEDPLHDADSEAAVVGIPAQISVKGEVAPATV